MRPETAATIVDMETPNLPMFEKMSAINELMEANGVAHHLTPFATVDIRFAEFLHFMNTNATQRERDMVIVSENLCRVWKTLHISVQTLKEQLSPQDEKEILLLSPAIHRLGLEHLILKGLNKKTAKIFTDQKDGKGF